jgi:hypothetical protein
LMNGGDALPGDCGYLLHAERLCLRHPATGSPIEVWCCPPPELRAVELRSRNLWIPPSRGD